MTAPRELPMPTGLTYLVDGPEFQSADPDAPSEPGDRTISFQASVLHNDSTEAITQEIAETLKLAPGATPLPSTVGVPEEDVLCISDEGVLDILWGSPLLEMERGTLYGDVEMQRWQEKVRATPPVTPTDSDRAALAKAEAKRLRRNAHRLRMYKEPHNAGDS